MIRFENAALRRGAKPLFADATLQVHPGERVGLVGANGCGKSSLFAMLLGELDVDQGTIAFPENWVTAHVAQETSAVERSALDVVLDGDSQWRQLQAELSVAEADAAECLDAAQRIATIHAELETIDGYRAESRARKLLYGLGFTESQHDLPVSNFSGGWRMRLNLANALMCRSDLLLLDEPTNHLDLDTVLWLERWLRQYQGTLLLISHDREFLDSVCNRVLHVEQQQLQAYTGNYSDFERMRAERLAGQQAAYEKQQREIAHMESFVTRFRAKASKAKQAQSRLKALEKMQHIAAAHVDAPFDFAFQEPEGEGDPLLQIIGGELGYSDAILHRVKTVLRPGTRLGLIGPNGAGKSTLIKALVNGETLLGGERLPAKALNIAYFAQHQLEQLRDDDTPLSHLQRLDASLHEEVSARATDQKLRSFLGGFAFQGDQALSLIKPMSGGEKARLVLAGLVWQRPNVLLLDEPTNHLDMEMRLALSQALQGFSGALVLVSHDRHLLRTVCDEFVLVAEGKAQSFEGDLEDYARWLSNRQAALNAGDSQSAPATEGAKADRRTAAERRAQAKPLRQAMERAEKAMTKLQSKLDKLTDQLADPTMYDADNKEKLTKVVAAEAACKVELEAAEIQWMEAAEAYEEAMG